MKDATKERTKGISFEPLERFLLEGFFPEGTSFLCRQMIRDIRKKAGLSKEEQKQVRVVNAGRGRSQVNLDRLSKLKEKFVEFTPTELSFLKDQVTRLSEEEKITDMNFNLCLKIKEYDLALAGGNGEPEEAEKKKLMKDVKGDK